MRRALRLRCPMQHSIDSCRPPSLSQQAARVQPQTTCLISPLQNGVVQSQNEICSYSTSKLKSSLVVFEDRTRRAEKVAKDKKKEEPRLCTVGDCIDSCINCGSTPSRLKRGPDGKFKDDLASVLYAAIESPTGAFGGLNTPESLRFWESGKLMARVWAHSMNSESSWVSRVSIFLGIAQGSLTYGTPSSIQVI